MSKPILFSSLLFLLSLALFAFAVDDRSSPELPADTLPEKIDLEARPGGFDEPPEIPDDNPLTEAKVKLGRKLFFDPVLSESKDVACASCHRPDHGFASPDAVAVGINGRVGSRNAPSILNRAYGETFLWDGGASSLEEQALTPIGNPDELGGSIEAVLKSLRSDKDYVAQFQAAFSVSDDADATADPATAITEERLAKAIASFERTLVTVDSQVDRFRNAEYGSMSKEARQGLWIFESRGGCWKCHSGPNLTDEDFHNTGVGFGQAQRDEGRMETTKNSEDQFKFKTPSLRGVEHTAPYMHNGSVKTLREVVDFYNKGGAPNDEQLDKKMKPLKLSDEEVGFVVEFLKALSN